jgi:hypothetical protein
VAGIRAESGFTDTEIAGSVMDAEAETAVFVMDVAVIVTVTSSDGATEGAL